MITCRQICKTICLAGREPATKWRQNLNQESHISRSALACRHIEDFFLCSFQTFANIYFQRVCICFFCYNKIELREITAVSQQTIPLYQYQEGIFGLKSSEKGKQKWRMKEIKSFEFLDTQKQERKKTNQESFHEKGYFCLQNEEQGEAPEGTNKSLFGHIFNHLFLSGDSALKNQMKHEL